MNKFCHDKKAWKLTRSGYGGSLALTTGVASRFGRVGGWDGCGGCGGCGGLRRTGLQHPTAQEQPVRNHEMMEGPTFRIPRVEKTGEGERGWGSKREKGRERDRSKGRSLNEYLLYRRNNARTLLARSWVTSPATDGADSKELFQISKKKVRRKKKLPSCIDSTVSSRLQLSRPYLTRVHRYSPRLGILDQLPWADLKNTWNRTNLGKDGKILRDSQWRE